MDSKLSNNFKLDRIGSLLVKRSVLQPDELEAIAAKSDLFSSVRRRIASENVSKDGSIAAGPLFLRPRFLTYAGLAAVAVLTAAVTIATLATHLPTKSRPAPVARHENVPPQAPVQFEPRHIQTPDEPEQAVYKPKERPVIQKTLARTAKTSEPQPEPLEFFALADMNSADPVAGGVVVRMDLPRASLIALGVNVPLGNDKQIIKTDLLIGPDGVPRAIRVVE